MKNILLLFVILLLVSCSEQKLESNTFELLPSTQQFSINSEVSTLDASVLQLAVVKAKEAGVEKFSSNRNCRNSTNSF